MRVILKKAGCAIAFALAASAIPANAQVSPAVAPGFDQGRSQPDWTDRDRSRGIASKIVQLENRIARHGNADIIPAGKLSSLSTALDEVRTQFHVFGENGLDNREARILESRLNRIRKGLGFKRSDSDGRFW